MKNEKSQSAIELANHFAAFIEYSRGRKSECTISGYRYAMQLFAEYVSETEKDAYAMFTLSYFTEENIRKFVVWMQETRGVKPQSCNLRISQLLSFLKYVSRIPEYKSLYLKIKNVTRLATVDTSKVIEPLTKSAISALMNAAGTNTSTGLRYTTIMAMLYTMATRIDEVLSIKVGELILDNGKPRVTVIGKGRKARTVYIMSKTLSLLRKYIVSEHGKNPDPNSYLFYSHSKGIHSKISERGVNKQLCKYAQKAHSVCSEVPEAVHTHQFRHSMATHCLDDGMNIFQISKMLGHKSVHTTMTYLGVTVAMTESAIKKIESSTVQTIKPKWKSGMKLKDLF